MTALCDSYNKSDCLVRSSECYRKTRNTGGGVHLAPWFNSGHEFWFLYDTTGLKRANTWVSCCCFYLLFSLCVAAACPVLCSGNGQYSRGRCQCYSGWKGTECDVPANQCIDIHCGGHGICIMGACICNTGYKGDNCEEGKMASLLAWFFIKCSEIAALTFTLQTEWFFSSKGNHVVRNWCNLQSLHLFKLL